MKKIYLQDTYSSLYNSILGKVSAATDDLGIYKFYRDQLPIESTTNAQVANRIASLIVKAMQRAPELKTFHVYELGAGLGILAWRILKHLQRHQPDLFEKTVFHLSDISATQIENLKQIPALLSFGKHLVFDVLDACGADFKEDEPPLIFYHTYLFDSLPTEVLHLSEGKLSVVGFRPWLPEDFCTFDFFKKKLSLLKPTDIRNVFESGESARISNLWGRLPELEYDIQSVPIEEFELFDSDGMMILKEVARLFPHDEGYFSFSSYHHQIIYNTSRSLHSEGFHLMVDLGSRGIYFNNSFRTIWSHAGCQFYCPVNHGLISLAASISGNSTHVAEYNYPGHLATVFVKSNQHWISPILKQHFADIWFPPELKDSATDRARSKENLELLLEGLVIPERSDSMYVQFELGYLHHALGRDEEALLHFNESLRLSLNTYIVAMVWIASLLLKKGHADLAWSYINTAVKSCPTFKLSWQMFAEMASQVNDYTKLQLAEEHRLELCFNAEVGSVIASLIRACELNHDTNSVNYWKQLRASPIYAKFEQHEKSALAQKNSRLRYPNMRELP